MENNINLAAQVITIILGILAFYGVVTKPIQDCISKLSAQIEQMNKDYNEIRIDIARIEASAKSAHHRIDRLEGE